MSAVEALAEVLRGHDWADKEREGQYYTPSIHAQHGYDSRCAVCRHDLEGQTSVLVAAIRSMPAEQVAELIGGTTQRIGRDEDSLHRYRVCGDWSDWR